MAYLIKHNNPLIDAEAINPDVIVTYDAGTYRFYVTFVETNTGYYQDRGSLVSSDFKFTNVIEDEILSGCETDNELDVVFTSRAHNEMYLLWMGNCDLF